ncbi:orotidine-5'-phosphate decarboxylase [Tuberibacillus sp. Marseille-P3662]|uniref:orotidine-5'-phosphate decarboxylase n=1 Tax=Tuberibacillus sp. Marseille-P3662 TaxID=1965358 RepID=UPI000A1CCC63|nr:orotidine-5'-phosphate decarboxylase [Tuberibacillus sp. Marseille-P3662]
MHNPVIVALDVASQAEGEELLRSFDDRTIFLKIGMELFYQEGPGLVKTLKQQGHQIFLDLKLHDIPTTVYKTMKGLARLGVDMVNVHAAGGKAMMAQAIAGLKAGTPTGKRHPMCLAVTQLTSTDEATLQQELLINHSMDDVIVSYGQLAAKSGCDGVVCSPWEAERIKSSVHQDFITVTPGIRFSEDAANDQKRIATPSRAKELGSDYIVVGRSIAKAQNPNQAYQRVLTEWRQEHETSS